MLKDIFSLEIVQLQQNFTSDTFAIMTPDIDGFAQMMKDGVADVTRDDEQATCWINKPFQLRESAFQLLAQ